MGTYAMPSSASMSLSGAVADLVVRPQSLAATLHSHGTTDRRAAHAALVVASGAETGRVVTLPEQTLLTVGRSPECALCFDDPKLSRVHARIVRMGAELLVEDAGSTNGVRVNGERVTESTALKNGDRVELGTVVYRFALLETREEEALGDLRRAATRDPLTGCLTRAALDEVLRAEVSHAIRHSLPMAVILIDVDRFKEVNDGRGHHAGDVVLRDIAERLRKTVRVEDAVARLGGDEFLVLARGTGLSGARVLGERLRAVVAARPVVIDGQEAAVTITGGAAALRECMDAPAVVIGLLKLADQRLYQAKAAGRNRVE